MKHTFGKLAATGVAAATALAIAMPAQAAEELLRAKELQRSLAELLDSRGVRRQHRHRQQRRGRAAARGGRARAQGGRRGARARRRARAAAHVAAGDRAQVGEVRRHQRRLARAGQVHGRGHDKVRRRAARGARARHVGADRVRRPPRADAVDAEGVLAALEQAEAAALLVEVVEELTN